MLQYSTYTVITPEGCATILWKSATRAAQAAEAMGVTSGRLKELGIVDRIIQEPLGGAHRDIVAASEKIKTALLEQIDQFSKMSTDDLLNRRYARLMSYGLNS